MGSSDEAKPPTEAASSYILPSLHTGRDLAIQNITTLPDLFR